MDFEILTMVPTRVFHPTDQGDRGDDDDDQIYRQIVCCHVAAAFYQSISSGYWRASYSGALFFIKFWVFFAFFLSVLSSCFEQLCSCLTHSNVLWSHQPSTPDLYKQTKISFPKAHKKRERERETYPFIITSRRIFFFITTQKPNSCEAKAPTP